MSSDLDSIAILEPFQILLLRFSGKVVSFSKGWMKKAFYSKHFLSQDKAANYPVHLK